MKNCLVLIFLFSFNFTFSQSVCDSLNITLVNVDAFTSNQLNIRVINSNTQEIFSYPGFRVYDENDNLIGEEEVFFFGIAGESTHSVFFDTSMFPFESGENQNLRIELWKNFYDEMVCEYDVTFQLLPVFSDCVDIELTLSEYSQEEVTYNIELTDYSGNPIHIESLIFAPSVGSISRNFCLPASCFYISINSEQAIEVSNVFMSLTASNIYGFYAEQILDEELENTIVFSIWQDCALINSISNIENKESLKIFPNPASENIQIDFDSNSPSEILLVNLLGETILHSQTANALSRLIDISSLASGTYFVILKQENGQRLGKFIKK